MSCSHVIDLSYPLDPTTPVYPNSPSVAIQVLESTQYTRTDGRRSLNIGRLSLGIHCGTHMDAPFHFFDEGKTIDRVSLDQCVGKAVLVNLTGNLDNGLIEPHHFSVHHEKLREFRKLVVQTGWSEKWGGAEYFTDHPVFTPEAARLLVDFGVELVGIDFPSVDRPPFPAHLSFLGSGAVIVENLTNLSSIQKAVFHLVVLPLRITGRDGSPVRAVALEAS